MNNGAHLKLALFVNSISVMKVPNLKVHIDNKKRVKQNTKLSLGQGVIEYGVVILLIFGMPPEPIGPATEEDEPPLPTELIAADAENDPNFTSEYDLSELPLSTPTPLPDDVPEVHSLNKEAIELRIDLDNINHQQREI